MTRFLVLLCVLLCAACSPSVHVYVASDAPDALVEATGDAVDWWNERLGFDGIELRVSDTPRAAYADLFSVLVKARDRVQGPEDRQAYTHAWGAWSVVLVERASIRTYDSVELRWLVAHELGHVFGLDHASGANLMTSPEWTPEQAWGLTREQRRRARAVVGLESAL